jgi:riboflavin kinase/FMN adenylyltransferase
MPLFRKDLKSGIDGLCNVGTRPTFDGKSGELRCEVFLFGKKGNFYGKNLRVVFLRRIRGERHFSSTKALVRQIDRDFLTAKGWAARFSFTK